MAESGITIPKAQKVPSDTIDGGNLNTAYGGIKNWLATSFDPNYFKVLKSGAGTVVTFARSLGGTSSFHFGGNWTASTVTINGGSWWVRYGDKAPTPPLQIKLTVDSGTCEDDTKVKTLTVDADFSASGYITVTIDSASSPTTLTASWCSTYPTDMTTVRVVGYVTVASTGDGTHVVTGWDQYHSGGDFQSFWFEPNGNSLNYDSNHKLQDYGWEGATGSPMTVSDLIVGRSAGAGNFKEYITLSNLCSTIIGTGGPWNGGSAPWAGGAGTKHNLLDFTGGKVAPYIANSAGNRNHSDLYIEQNAAWNLSASGDVYGVAQLQSIGRYGVTPTQAIDLVNSILYDAANKKSVDWSAGNRILYDVAGNGVATFNAAGVFEILVAAVLKVSNTTDSSDATGTTGAGQFLGGISVLKTIWSGSGFKTDTSKYALSTGNFNWESLGNYGIKSLAAKTEIYHDTRLDLECNDIWYGRGIHQQEGQSISGLFAYGGFVGTGFSLMTIAVPDGSGGMKAIQVLGKDA